MKRTQPKLHHCARALLLAALPLAIGQALAASQMLRADRFSFTPPGGGPAIQMWGYAGDNAACNAGPGYPAWTPGPAIPVPVGEDLTVTLKNCLDVPTSLVIPGQTTTMTPVWVEPATIRDPDNAVINALVPNPAAGTTYTGARPANNHTAVVRSFTHEAAAGGLGVYSWPAIKPGTYLYQSGSHPQVQIQMGLYGSLTKDADAGNVAYRQAGTDVAYGSQTTLLYSEIDPALHAAVADGSYGTSGPTSTLDYHPKYFLINGQAYPDASLNPLATVPAGQGTLLRFLNAGLKPHVPTINGQYWKMIAEDGNPYPYLSNPRQQYTAFLAPGKTMDVLLTPGNPSQTEVARHAIFDSRHFDTNNGAQGGGLLAYLDVTPGSTAAAPVFDSAPVMTGTAGIAYSYVAHATDPNGDPVSYTLNPVPPAGMVIAPDGTITWTPAAAGSYPVSVRASDGTLFNDQAFNVAVAPGAPVNQAPTARNEAYTAVTHPVASGLTQVVAAPGVLGNDTDPEGDALHTGNKAGSPRVTLAANGGFTLAPANTLTPVVFTYQALDTSNAASGTATVTITMIGNRAPTAVADALSVPRCSVRVGTGTTCRTSGAPGFYVPPALNLVSNDSDPDSQTIDVANQLPLAVARVRAQTAGGSGGSTSAVTTSSGGRVAISGGSVTYVPPYNFAGTDVFQYRVKDKLNKESGSTTGNSGNFSQGWVTVTITVQ